MTPRAIRILVALLLAGALLALFGWWLWNHPLLDIETPPEADNGPQGAAQPANAPAVRLHYAQGFTVERIGSYTLVTVLNPRQDATRRYRYLLAPRGAPAGEAPNVGADAVIAVPIERLAALSPTYLPAIEELGALDRLVAVGHAERIYSPAVLRGIAEGHIVDAAPGGMPDIERLLALGPCAVMTAIINETDGGAAMMAQTGLPVVINAEYMEPTPLGRAEWVKFVALLLGREAEAERFFDALARNYRVLAERARGAAPAPSVLLNTEFKGTWYMPGGQSYVAHMVADAGGRYPWAGMGAEGTLPLDFESVYARAAEADVWLVMSAVESADAMRRRNGLYARFSAFRSGRLYNNDARATPTGGNDYWETALARPDLLLADLVRIMHPDLLPDHELMWFRAMR